MKRAVAFLLLAVFLFSFAAADEIELFYNKKIRIQEIQIENTEIIIKKGKSEKIKYAILPANATNKALKWSTSDKQKDTASVKSSVRQKMAAKFTPNVL